MLSAAQESEQSRARARVGLVLKGKWRLDELLGIGGMAVVYAATHRNGNRVAMKMLHAELARDPDIKARFLREGYLANAVEHAGVVSVIDDDVCADGSVFLVMELLEGETIERRWERKGRRLPVVEVLSITDRLLDVLASAHAREIVHRDIKPENVFLTCAGEIKVLDFGIARVRALSPRTNATQGGTTMGTPPFMPPEQARGRWDDVDARTDLWAVGATMFTLLTGRFVHEADTVNEQLLSAMTRVAPKVSSLAPEIPREVAEVVDRALAFRKDARWEDARAMKGAIRRAYKAMRGDAASNLPIAPRSSHVDKREVVTVVAGDSANDGRDVSEAGVVAAPSAAPFADTLASARVPNRRPLILGLLAAGMGAAIAFSAFTRHPMPTPIASASAGVGDAVAITLPAADDPHLTFPTEEALAAPVEVAAGDAGRPTVSTSLALRTGRPASGGREGAAAETPSVSGPLAPKNSPDLLDRRR